MDAATDAVEWSLTLARHIADLDPRDQQLLQLRFVEELTQVEIARRLNVSQMQVSRLLQRVLDRLRAVLGHDDLGGGAVETRSPQPSRPVAAANRRRHTRFQSLTRKNPQR